MVIIYFVHTFKLNAKQLFFISEIFFTQSKDGVPAALIAGQRFYLSAETPTQLLWRCSGSSLCPAQMSITISNKKPSQMRMDCVQHFHDEACNIVL